MERPILYTDPQPQVSPQDAHSDDEFAPSDDSDQPPLPVHHPVIQYDDYSDDDDEAFVGYGDDELPPFPAMPDPPIMKEESPKPVLRLRVSSHDEDILEVESKWKPR